MMCKMWSLCISFSHGALLHALAWCKPPHPLVQTNWICNWGSNHSFTFKVMLKHFYLYLYEQQILAFTILSLCRYFLPSWVNRVSRSVFCKIRKIQNVADFVFSTCNKKLTTKLQEWFAKFGSAAGNVCRIRHCDTVGAFKTRGLRFDSSNHQFLTFNCIEKTKTKKKRPGKAHLKTHLTLYPSIYLCSWKPVKLFQTCLAFNKLNLDYYYLGE